MDRNSVVKLTSDQIGTGPCEKGDKSVEIVIPVGLTAARIQRVNPAIGKEAAEALAVELHDIVGLLRKFYSVHPDPDESFPDEEADVVDTVMRTAVNVWPFHPDAGASESIWLFERFLMVGADKLYDRYLAVCSSVYGVDLYGVDFTSID